MATDESGRRSAGEGLATLGLDSPSVFDDDASMIEIEGAPGAAEQREADAKVRGQSRTQVWILRSLIVVVVLGLWQVLPQWQVLRQLSPVFDPFFVSSPKDIAVELGRMATGNGTDIVIWSYLAATLRAAIIGTVVGTIAGGLAGLMLSNMPRLNRVIRPFVLALNATPRIALIPIIIIIVGPGSLASIITSTLVVFFIVFYNAYEGGTSIPSHVIDNARLLGAKPTSILFRVRFPLVMAWTFAAVPNAVSLGLVSVITAEVLTGSHGLGSILVASLSLANATLTFAVVVVMALTGVALVTLSTAMRGRLLHWWTNGDSQLA